MSVLKTILKRVAVVLILIYVGFGALLFFAQSGFIYYPSAQDFDACPQFSDSEKVDHQGTRFYYKKNSDKLVVFYHGNAGSACDRSFLKDAFSDLGYSSIIVEYTGYSNDSRKPSQRNIMQDVENINVFLKSVDRSELVIAGESLGASLAVYHSSIADEDKLLLISPFYSLEDATRSHYPFYPVSWMLRDKYESHRWLGDMKQVRIIHGDSDTILPIGGSKKLFGEMPATEKKLTEIPGANHNDLYDFPETFSALSDFLSEDVASGDSALAETELAGHDACTVLPPKLELPGGVLCEVIEEETFLVEEELANYECSDGTWLIGVPDRDEKLWTIRQAALAPGGGAPETRIERVEEVKIKKAWR